MLEIGFSVTARCKGCGLERELDKLRGKVVAAGETTQILRASQPCSCGSSLVCVTFDVNAPTEEAPESG